ncbi:cytochrome c biogenesis protein CcsA [Variovorax sp. YR752]|uniref:cytochrome C assembly family protein n=1 Tax=Variovorax sp. YR752 TaxID=1884383 RepID=UPI00313792D0
MILSVGPGGDMGWALLLPTLAALVAYALAAVMPVQREAALRNALLAGWVAHALSIVVDIGGIGATVSGARFGFAPALSVTMWLVLAVYAVESRFLPLAGVQRTLALLGAAAVLLALIFPGELRPNALSRWAPLHWVLGIASYGLFGAAVLHGAMLNRAEQQLRQRTAPAAGGMPLLRLERLTFRFVGAGFVVLSAALLLGAWFANPWRWDHKTVFSMLGWVVFAALLAGRRAFGWRGPIATRWLYGGAALLLLAYVGSRFVLEILLQRPPAN